MTINNIPKEVEARLVDFFSNTTDPKEMAKIIRQVNYILSLSAMKGCETVLFGLDNVEDNFYWLNQLAEVLDPYLDVN